MIVKIAIFHRLASPILSNFYIPLLQTYGDLLQIAGGKLLKNGIFQINGRLIRMSKRHIPFYLMQEVFRAERIQSLSDALIHDDIIQFEHPYVTGRHRLINWEGVMLIYRDWTVPAPITLETKHEQPFLKMQFELDGHSSYAGKIITSCNQVDILHGRHTLLFLPEVEGTLFYPNSRKVLDVVFTRDYFCRIFEQDLQPLGKIGKAISQQHPGLLGKESRPLTPAMSQVINEILQCPYQGIFKKTYLEAKVIELLNLQLDQFRQEEIKPKDPFKLRKEDINRLHQLKELIQSNPGADYSLNQLSEQIGFNDFKLKKGFKQLFGNTVFGYINDVRMEQSYRLLREGTHSVSTVSYLMGFKYPHHFSHAFKKKFGLLPKSVKS